MAQDIDWGKLVKTAEGPSVCSYAFDCIICNHSVPINSARQPGVPICQECLKTIRELVSERRGNKG